MCCRHTITYIHRFTCGIMKPCGSKSKVKYVQTRTNSGRLCLISGFYRATIDLIRYCNNANPINIRPQKLTNKYVQLYLTKQETDSVKPLSRFVYFNCNYYFSHMKLNVDGVSYLRYHNLRVDWVLLTVEPENSTIARQKK